MVIALDIHLGGVILAPLLSGLAHTIIHDEHTIAIHTVDDRLSGRGTCLQACHTADLGQERGEVTPEASLDLLGAETTDHGISRDHTTCTLHGDPREHTLLARHI